MNGVLNPLIVRPKNGAGYEIVSGHRRYAACQKLGVQSLPVIVRDPAPDEATLCMIDSNHPCEHLLPSEKAYAYKAKMDVLNRKGQRYGQTSSQPATRWDAATETGKATNESRDQVFRYIRLTNLIKPLMDIVDSGRIAFIPAVELSYLPFNIYVILMMASTMKKLYIMPIWGSIHATRAGLKSKILQGEEGVVACQSYIKTLIHSVAMSAVRMTQKIKVSSEEAITAYTFAIDILKRLFSDNNVGFYAHDLSLYYFYLALQYAELNDKENTLNNLEESCRYAIIEANLKDMNYTAPMANRLKHKNQNTSKNYRGNDCNFRLKALEDRRFDFVRDEDVCKKIIADLEKHAE